jgi:hypothetical protein
MRTSLHHAAKEVHDFAFLADENCRDVISASDRIKAEGMLRRFSQNLIRLDRLLTVLENTRADI